MPPGCGALLRTIGPDVVVQRAAGSQTALLGLYCALNRKRFVYMTAADSDVEPARPAWFQGNAAWRAYRLGLRLADRVIVQHDRQRQRLMDNYGKAGIVRPCALEAADATPAGERRNDPVGRPLRTHQAAGNVHLTWRTPSRRSPSS